MDLLEFKEGMTNLFSESYEKQSKFIFNFYDFDKDGKISKDDVRTVLSYIPLKTKKYSKMKLKYEMEGDFKDRIESQDELYTTIEKSFNNNETLDEESFLNIIENINSDIFLFILIFLLEKRPFTKNTLVSFEKSKQNNRLSLNLNKTPVLLGTKMIASPNLDSKLTPSTAISKSPSILKRYSLHKEIQDSKNLLMKLTGKSNNDMIKFQEKDLTTESQESIEENVQIKNIPVNRKHRNNLKILEETKSIENKSNYTDLPITPAIKHPMIQ